MNVTETFSLAVRFILREKLKFTYMQDSINEGDIVMKFAEFLEEMKVKYGDDVRVKLNDGGKVVPENLPQELIEFYQSYDFVEFPFGEVYPLHVTLKEDEPFKSEGWLCFGFDGYFSYWLCKKETNDMGTVFTSWDHEVDDEMEATHDDFVEFLMEMERDFEELNELDKDLDV